MRKKHISQASIFEYFSEHETGKQLKAISAKLDVCPQIIELAASDLIDPKKQETGRNGMSVDSVVRSALLKQMMSLSYDDLSFYLDDSHSYQTFARTEKSPSKSSLQSNISQLSADTWEKINLELLNMAKAEQIENGDTIRIDSTVTETDVHPPTDSSLLWDCVRVMRRLLTQIKEAAPTSIRYPDHTRAAKKKAYRVAFARKANKTKLYKELLSLTDKTKGYLQQAVLQKEAQALLIAPVIECEAQQLILLTEKVISQAERRVLQGLKVPNEEKVFSIFETHTDIIIKGARDIQYGHKLNITTGISGMVLDVVIEEGNPADTAQLCPMIERQKNIYGQVPKQVAVDGGYASKDNLSKAKAMGVTDMAFQKKRGLKIKDMVTSSALYKKLSDFRAGIEGNISCLKRRYGLSRCLWKGEDRFKSYIWVSSVAYNLMPLARLEIAT